MFKLQGWVEEGNTVVNTGGLSSSNVVQGSFPLSTVTVFVHSTAVLATIYSDDNTIPTPLANPFVANADGTWGFYAASGRYDVVFSGGDLPSPITISDLTNGAGGGTGTVVGPLSAVNNDVVAFDGTSGSLVKDSGRLYTTLVDSPVAGVGGHLVVYDSGSGVRIRDAGIGITGLVTGPASAISGHLAVFQGGSGKILADGGAISAGGFAQFSTVTRTAGDLTTTSTSFVDATSMTLTLTTGAHRCQINVNANCQVPIGGILSVDIDIDGSRLGQTLGLSIAGNSAPQIIENVSFSIMSAVLSAGSHTFKIQWKVNGGTGTLYASTSVTPLILSVAETSLTT